MDSESLLAIDKLLDMLVRTSREPGDLTGTLEHIAQTARKFFAGDASIIFAINPITSRFIESLSIAGNFLKRDLVFFEQPRPQGITQEVLKRGVLLVPNLEATPQYHSRFTRAENIRSFVGLALHIPNSKKPLGVLYINFRQQREFTPDDRNLLQIFADQASFILQETWLLRRYKKVAHIGQEINQELATIDELFQKLKTHVASILDTSHALVLSVYQPQSNTFNLYMQEGKDFIQQEHMLSQGACQHAIKIPQTIFIEHLYVQAKDLPFQIVHIPGTGPKESFIFVPLTLRDEPLGVLSIQHPEPHAYTQEDRSILELLANHIALALHNIRMDRSLNQLNEIDEILTQQLDSEQTLQAVVDKIRDATKADLVVLYPFDSTRNSFIFPPRIAGDLLDATSSESIVPNQPGSGAKQILRRAKPIFAQHDSTHLRQGSIGQREQIRSTVAMPLRVGEEAVGLLFVNFRQLQHFDTMQKLFLESLAHYAAIAIKNAQTFGTLSQRRVQEMVIFQHIDRQLSRTLLDLNSFLNTLLKLVQEYVAADEATILLYNPQLQALEAAAAIGPHADVKAGRTISLQQARGISYWVFNHKRPARVDNVHLDPQWRNLYVSVIDEIVSELDVPLLDGEEVVGILNFESTREKAFRREDEEFLVTLAGQVVLAVKNAQAYERERRLKEEAQELAAEAQALNAISKEITSQLDLARVFDLILELALKLTNSTLGSLHLYDPKRNDLWMAAGRGVAQNQKGMRLRLGQGVVGHAAAFKQVFTIVDVSQPPWDSIYVEFIHGTRSELAVPMLEGDEIRGVLNIESPLLDNFHESDERLLRGLAGLAVVAQQNAERYDQAKREAQRFALLYKAGQELGKITELLRIDQAYEAVMQIAVEHSQCEVVIRRYDDETQELVLMRASQPHYFQPHLRTKVDEGINGQVAQERRTIDVPDTQHPPPDVVPLKLSDPTARSLVITPIIFKDRYYGNLRLSNENVGHFQRNDVLFFEGLAHQLATTIYRLETAHERQEFKQKVIEAEAMSAMGQATFELTHRLKNDLGLVQTYVNSIRSELKTLEAKSTVISEKLDHIVQAVGKVLHLNRTLREDWLRWGQAGVSEPVVIHPIILLEEASKMTSLPSIIQIGVRVDPDVSEVRIMHSLVTDILRNLITNAIEAMPEGGKITLGAHSAGRSVAVEVSDTGPGIPVEYQSKIFNLFFSTKRSTGFGLWSARRNALSHHGDLTVKCDSGQGGTTFTLLLPKAEEDR